MTALSEYNLPYYATAYMLHCANTAIAMDALCGEDPVTTTIRHGYLWHITDGIASRMGVPMSNELMTGHALVDKIVPGLARVSLYELAVPALQNIIAQHQTYSPGELGGHVMTVNLLMADAHAELYETRYNPGLLPAVSLD